MVNLLPPQEKEQLKKEQTKRIRVILWLLLLLFLVSLALILLSIEIYLNGEFVAQKIVLESVKQQLVSGDVKQIQEKLRAVDQTTLKLKLFYGKQGNLADALSKIGDALPKDTYLTNLSTALVSQEGQSTIEVALSGFAPARENLFDLKKNLENENAFKDIFFAPENWVQPTNINFSVTLKIFQ